MTTNQLGSVSPILTTYAAGKILGLACSTMNKMRMNGNGPAFIKLGPRRVGYELEELEKWKNRRRYLSTSQYDRR